MKFSTVAVGFAAAGAVAAMPIEKRAVVTNYVHVTRFVYENAHVMVDQNGNPVSTSYELVSTAVEDAPAAPTTSSVLVAVAAVPSSSPSPSSKSTSTSTVFVTYVPPSSTAAPPPPPPPTTSSTPPPPPPTTSSPPPPPPPTTTSTPPPPPPPTTSTPPPPPPTTSTPPPPAPTTSTPPPPPPSSSTPPPAQSSSSSGQGTFSGQATFYTPGLGACGETNTENDFIAALNAPQFGNPANPNADPYCGKKAQIFRNGKSVTVTITDKCPTCAYGNLDLSPAAFNEIADPAEGRVEITWSFI